jgi:hypothetical protein
MNVSLAAISPWFSSEVGMLWSSVLLRLNSLDWQSAEPLLRIARDSVFAEPLSCTRNPKDEEKAYNSEGAYSALAGNRS